MTLDFESMMVRHDGIAWAPPKREWTLIVAMAAKPDRVWERDTLLALTGSPGNDIRCVDTWMKNIRREFRKKGWPNPIVTRYGLGYVWDLRMGPPVLVLRKPVIALEEDHFSFQSQAA